MNDERSKTFAHAWNKAPVWKRVKLAHAAHMEGKKGSAAWGDLTQEEKDLLTQTIHELSARYQKRRGKVIHKTAKRLGVSDEYISTQPIWIQENRAATVVEMRDWGRHQHEKSCKRYEPAEPISHYNGKCGYCIHGKPCTSFYSHTGLCETGIFEPDRIQVTKWSDFQRLYRRANRTVNRVLGGAR